MKNHNHSILHTISVLALVFLIFALLCRPETAFQQRSRVFPSGGKSSFRRCSPFSSPANCWSNWRGETAGQRLSPLMRPLFALPGPASLAVVMGFCAGFPPAPWSPPVYIKNICWKKGKRNDCLLFPTTPGRFTSRPPWRPACSIVRRPPGILALSHYGLNLLLGILLGFFAPKRVLPRFSAATETASC